MNEAKRRKGRKVGRGEDGGTGKGGGDGGLPPKYTSWLYGAASTQCSYSLQSAVFSTRELSGSND